MRHAPWWFWGAGIMLVGVMPFSNFVGHPHWGIVEWWPFQRFVQSPEYRVDLFVDAVANVLLFVPFGFLFPFGGKAGRGHVILRVLGTALFISLSIELYQVFSHYRSPSMADVFSNSVGAVVGATIARRKEQNQWTKKLIVG